MVVSRVGTFIDGAQEPCAYTLRQRVTQKGNGDHIIREGQLHLACCAYATKVGACGGVRWRCGGLWGANEERSSFAHASTNRTLE